MNKALISYYIKKLSDYLAIKTEMVDHRAVIKEVATGVDRSWIYYSMLMLASLIALLGLLTNSIAVIIGAMLISPLMGPIISSGLAFTIGDLTFARRAFKTIAISVALTILACTVVSFISPLKEQTAEILARVHPNIFDLFVAMLSGIVGAIALCTKRNYLITSTGVAIATAVIPPLSVTGYGLGTGQLMLAMGGFLLFFTNFVAIVLTSDLVFFIFGFRTSHLETVQYSPRKRLLIIAGLLTLISVPLVYTLVADLTKVKEKKRIERVLKLNLNKDLTSRMTSYDYQQHDEKILIRASVNTVKIIDKQSELKMEKELTDALKRPVAVRLEQIIVASGEALKPPKESELMTGGTSPAVKVETSAQIRTRVEQMVIDVQRELTDALAPFPVSDTHLTFGGGEEPLQVSTTLKRDYPVEDDEKLLLARFLERSLELPVTLTVKTVPLLPPLSFDGTGALTPASTATLALIKELPGGRGEFRFILESSSRENTKRLETVKLYLIHEQGVPERSIVIRAAHTATESAGVILRIIRR
ncbi:MAG: TIGR00341 family protein [Geobacter sp.]|nr:MAG: TIGR00341 family protein [Geobacter sp.]